MKKQTLTQTQNDLKEIKQLSKKIHQLMLRRKRAGKKLTKEQSYYWWARYLDVYEEIEHIVQRNPSLPPIPICSLTPDQRRNVREFEMLTEISQAGSFKKLAFIMEKPKYQEIQKQTGS